MLAKTKITVLLLTMSVMASCNSIALNDEESVRETNETKALIELQSQISNYNKRVSQGKTKTRNFKSWWEHFCDRVSSIVYADAGGAAGGFDGSAGRSWTERGRAALSEAVSCSWEEYFDPIEERSLGDYPSSPNVYMTSEKASSLHELISSQADDEVISSNPTNPMDLVGKAHNMVFYRMAMRSQELKGKSKVAIQKCLNEEIAKTFSEISKDFSCLSNHAGLGSNTVLLATSTSLSTSGTSENQGNKSKYYQSQSSERVEREILDSYSHRVSSTESPEEAKSYYDGISHLVESSSVSKETKNRMLLYISVSTHSKALWSRIIEKEVSEH